MVTFITKVQVETILVSIDTNARNEIKIANVILILARLGFRLTKDSRKYLNIDDVLKRRARKSEQDFFEIRVTRHTDAEVIMFEKQHGIKIPHLSTGYKQLKITSTGDKFVVWYKDSKDESEEGVWTEVSDI